jgi:hypothetical protein
MPAHAVAATNRAHPRLSPKSAVPPRTAFLQTLAICLLPVLDTWTDQVCSCRGGLRSDRASSSTFAQAVQPLTSVDQIKHVAVPGRGGVSAHPAPIRSAARRPTAAGSRAHTGKTHTTANLICHAMATGQRVLVVSRGEAALSVLRDQLPEEVQPLAISALSIERQGLRQIESAIREIQAVVDGTRPENRRSAIRRLQGDRWPAAAHWSD